MTAEQPTEIGKYSGLKVAGRGSTATVYRGYDLFSDRDVAIKLSHQMGGPDQDHLARKLFFNEAQAAGALLHPNIVKVLDAGEHASSPYLVMEYVGGGTTLLRHCKNDGLLPPQGVGEIVFHCARALDYSHRNGIIHRDVKPSNILLNEAGQAKLTDFGIALRSRTDETQILGLMGSPLYMSPEQIRQGTLTPQTDIYSLGVVMYELLSGTPPFAGDNLASLMYSIVNEDPSKPALGPDVPPDAIDIMERAIRKRPADRFDSAGDMADALCDVFSIQTDDADVIPKAQKLEQVRTLEFFSEFSESELGEILDRGIWTQYCTDETIFVEGSIDLAFYIIAAGSVEVRKGGTELCRLDTGACFGEMSYLAQTRRSASIIAKEPVLLLCLPANVIKQASEACQLRFNERFIRTLIERLNHTSDGLVEATRNNAAERACAPQQRCELPGRTVAATAWSWPSLDKE